MIECIEMIHFFRKSKITQERFNPNSDVVTLILSTICGTEWEDRHR